MEITEVRIKLMEDASGSNERLQAFCSITFDDMFVIRDLKIIEGAKGFFVAMPSRKLTDRCNHCGTKNHLRSRFCNQCGARLDENRAMRDADGRAKLHADIAHPINSGGRERIQSAVLEAYADELERSKQPGYMSQVRRHRRRLRISVRRSDRIALGAGTATCIPQWAKASRPCEEARSAATPSTHAAVRCSAVLTFPPGARNRPKAWPPPTTTQASPQGCNPGPTSNSSNTPTQPPASKPEAGFSCANGKQLGLR